MPIEHRKTYRISGTGTPVLSATIALVPEDVHTARQEAYTEGFIDGVSATVPPVDGVGGVDGVDVPKDSAE